MNKGPDTTNNAVHPEFCNCCDCCGPIKDLVITNNIRKLRVFANEMTQLELAERTRSSRSTIIAVEAGKYTPSLELAFKIAMVFGVPIGEVFECRKENQKKE
jgi:putative transcriptional regulator